MTVQLLPKDSFPYIDYEHIKTYLSGIKFTKHFQCYELLIAEIYEFIPNDVQLIELQKLRNKINPDLYIWANEHSIKSLGVEPQKKLVADISEHSSWIL